jgi:uncharacterized cupin superfamily protein
MNAHRAAWIAAILVVFVGINLASEPPPKPIKLSKDQIAGKIFEDFKPIVTKHENERGPYTTHDVEAFLSSDKQFDAGMYRSGPNRHTISEPYGVNEFMYFVEGGVKLTSKDGTVQVINAGDAVVIPKEWTGIWETDGYMKIYVIYSPGKPIE